MFVLDGMEFPDWETPADALDFNAVELFMQSAQRARPDFTLAADDLTYVARICRLVQGMPLGILLAAAWIDLLSPQEIAEEISQSIDFLETELRDVSDRQRSIRAVFEHSWGRLGETERNVFMKLSVFRGGFSREAAQAVAGASLKLLSALANKSLLQRQHSRRYTIHELLRQYAEAELAAAGQTEIVLNAHSAHFANFLQQREADLKAHRQKSAAAEIEADFENVRVAWNWAVEQTQVAWLGQAINSLGIAYEWFGRYQEGEAAFARAADKLAETELGPGRRLLANVLIGQASFGLILGSHERARQLLHQSLALLKTPALAAQDTRPEQAATLRSLGIAASRRGDLQETERRYEQSLALYRRLSDRRGEAAALLGLAGVGINHLAVGGPKQQQQQAEASKKFVLEGLAIFRALGDQANIATGLRILGLVYLNLGQTTEVQVALKECIAVCNELGHVNNTDLIAATAWLGVALGDWGLYKQMRAQGQLALTLAQEIGDARGIHLGLNQTGCAALTAW